MTVTVQGCNNTVTGRPEVILILLRETLPETIPATDTKEQAESVLRSLAEKNVIKIIEEEAICQ